MPGTRRWTALAAAGLGEALEPLQPDEVARRTGSDAHLAGVFDPDVAHLQPAALARGMARVAEAQGIRIHEGTRMTALGRTSPPSVTTSRGVVRAGTVVLAVNAWAARLPEVRRSLVVTSSDVIATPRDPAAARADRLDVGARPVRVRLAPARELLPPDT